MSDIITDLREVATCRAPRTLPFGTVKPVDTLEGRAADEIERLRMRNAEAESWLRTCLGQVEGMGLANWDAIRDFLKESD